MNIQVANGRLCIIPSLLQLPLRLHTHSDSHNTKNVLISVSLKIRKKFLYKDLKQSLVKTSIYCSHL